MHIVLIADLVKHESGSPGMREFPWDSDNLVSTTTRTSAAEHDLCSGGLLRAAFWGKSLDKGPLRAFVRRGSVGSARICGGCIMEGLQML